MKTEPISVVVTEPGKGKRKNPYLYQHGSNDWASETKAEHKARIAAYKDFEANNPIRDCIDSDFNDLQPGRYLCKEVFLYRDKDGTWVDETEDNLPFPNVKAYQLIDDAVKGENEPKIAVKSTNVEQFESVVNYMKSIGFKENTDTPFYYGEDKYPCIFLQDQYMVFGEMGTRSLGYEIIEYSDFVEQYLHSTPVNEAKQVIYKDIEERAFKFTELNPDINPAMAYIHGAIDERAAHLIENKEGVKSVEDILNTYYPVSHDNELNTDLWPTSTVLAAMKEHAQLTPIEQGKRMVDVEEVIKLLESYRITSLKSKDHAGDYAENLFYQAIQEVEALTNQQSK